jgi:catechol 2,3-dioxygenase-like lactoylglutathione lyase family enzyme
MSPVGVRYIADDVESATAFYRDNLGFTVKMSPAPGFAVLSRGELRLCSTRRQRRRRRGDARRPDARGGGWNRIQLEVEDLAGEVEACVSGS